MALGYSCAESGSYCSGLRQSAAGAGSEYARGERGRAAVTLLRLLPHSLHQRLLLFGQHLLDRRALLHLAPPGGELRPALAERLRAEHRQHEVREEEGRGESAIGEREGAADREGPRRELRLELVEPEVQLRELLRDELLVPLLRARLRKERAERRLQVEVVEARDAAHPRAGLRLLRQERRAREALLEELVDDLGLPDDLAVDFEGRGLPHRVDLQVLGRLQVATGDRNDVDLRILLVDRQPALRGEVAEVRVIELHRGLPFRGGLST